MKLQEELDWNSAGHILFFDNISGWYQRAKDQMTEITSNNVPYQITTASERFVLHVKNRLNFELDFTPDTFSVLDHFIKILVQEESREPTSTVKDMHRAPLIHLIAPLAGAYFGEVIKSVFPARWRFTTQEPPNWRLELEDVFLRFNPAGIAADVISNKSVDAWAGILTTSPALTMHLHERFEAAPPLPEDEFYTFVSRYEAIQIAEDYLKERASKDGTTGRTEADYDKILGI